MAKKSFAEKMASYKTYDPSKEGYGNTRQWGRAFNETMGVEEAAAVMGEDNPLSVLGFTELPTMAVLKKVYRGLMLRYHPDVEDTGDAERATKIIAAYTTLVARIERQG